MPSLITAQHSAGQKSFQDILRAFLLTWFIAGTADALAAIYLLAHGEFIQIFQYIASAVFGHAAYTGGTGMVYWGILFHYLVAGSFTAFYFIIYPYVPLFRKSVVWSAMIYGVFVHVVMSRLVLPLTHVPPTHFKLIGAIKNAVILMFTLGLPNALLRRRI